MDTLPVFRRTVADAGLEPDVIAVVGDSPLVAAYWGVPLGLLFIVTAATAPSPPASTTPAGRRTPPPAGAWSSTTCSPTWPDGGRPPYEEIYLPALRSGHFVEVTAVGSLRVLERTV